MKDKTKFSNTVFMKNKNNLIEFYVENKLIPFSLTVNYIDNCKKLIMPSNWIDANINNYKSFINESNCMGIKMGSSIDNEFKIICVDVDNKTDDDILNGVTKWHEITKNLNINTMIQQTANKGFHYLFKVTNEQYKNIKNIITLKIDNKKYAIDVKANANSFIICEPSKIYDDQNGKILAYKWINKDNIQIIPDEVYNLIKIQNIVSNIPTSINTDVPINSNVDINLNAVKTELKAIIPYFNFLSCARVNKYTKWHRLLCLIKTIFSKKDALKLIVELSRKSKHYKTDEWIIEKFNAPTHNKYKINTFYYWLKQDNPEKYQELFKQVIKIRKADDINIKPIKINSEYLTSLDDELNEDTILNNNINNFFNSDIKSLNIKSPYDTGKTQLLKKIINKYDQKKILWLSYRITLTQDIKGNFQNFGFKSYLEEGVNYADENRLIIQLESLLNLQLDNFCDDFSEVPSFDLIIIDEVESILNQFNSPTFKGKSKDTFIFLEEIIKNSNKLITLDGDINSRAYSFINSFGDGLYIVNEYKKNKKVFNIIDDVDNFDKLLFKSLDNNEKVVIVSQSRTQADIYYKKIEKAYESLEILLYTSFTDDAEKRKLDDVYNIWSKCDVLIYSPTIEAGVNFDKVHFNKIFGIFSDNSTSQRSFLQMLNRVRKVTDNEIIINNGISNFQLNEVNEYFNYFDASICAQNINSISKTGEYVTENGKRLYKVKYDNYTNNYLYNLIEDGNKTKYYFLALFKDIIESKGHALKFNDISRIKNFNIEVFNIDDFEDKFDDVIKTLLVNKTEFQKLNSRKKQNNATEDDKLKLIKYYFYQLLGLKRTDELNYDQLNFWYYNKHLIKNFKNLINIDEYKKTNELQNNINFEKLKLVKNLLSTLNFNDIFNKNKHISGDELKSNFIKFTEENKALYQSFGTCNYYFKLKPLEINDKLTIKKILGHINSILVNYSIKIDNKRMRINGDRENFYFISIENEVDIIIDRQKQNYMHENFLFEIKNFKFNNSKLLD